MILSRAIPTLPEITGRTIEGLAAPFMVPASVTDDGGASRYWEQILPEAANKTIADRQGGAFPLHVFHPLTSNKGRMPAERIGDVYFTPGADGLEFHATVDRSDLGDEMLDLVRDEVGDDVSLCMRPIRNIEGTYEGARLVSRAEIGIRELSLCPAGTAQHPGSKVLVMRASHAAATATEIAARLRLLDL